MSTTRKITAFSTRGKQKSTFDSDAKTWGELKSTLENEGFDLGNLAATESINRTDLAHKDAVLPEGDFTIFLRPTKTKSGADYASMSYKDLRGCLNDDDKAALAEITGKNWTRCSRADIEEYLNNKDNSGTTATSTATPKEETTNEVEAPMTNTIRISRVKTLLSEIAENSSDDEVSDRLDLVNDEVEGLADAIEAEESPEAAQAKKEEEERIAAEQAEADRLAKEADDLMDGF